MLHLCGSYILAEAMLFLESNMTPAIFRELLLARLHLGLVLS